MTDETNLSEREKDVLKLVALGLTNREIAQKLSISPNTVKVHISNIFEKTGVASRTEATVFAIERRIVDVPGGEVANQAEDHSLRGLLARFSWVWVTIIILVSVLLGTLLYSSLVQKTPEENGASLTEMNRWQELTPLPEPRSQMATVFYDGKVYAIAGEGPAGLTNSVLVYDIENENWTEAQKKPTAVSDVDGVLIGEKIYIPGGRGEDDQPTNKLEIYDPRLDSWEEGPALPTELSSYALIGYEGRIYLFGGWDGSELRDSVYIFDPSINEWYEGAPMLHKALNIRAAVSGGEIYVIGGTEGEDHLSFADAYLPNRDQAGENPWVTVSSIPQLVWHSIFGMEEMGDLIILVAPVEEGKFTFMFYYPQQDQWINSSDITSELFPLSSSSVSVQGYLYLFGGVNADGALSSTVSRYQGLFITAFPNISQ